MKVKWKCNLCGDTVISDSKERHTMDYCKCKQSAYDLEEFYARLVGYCVVLEIVDGDKEKGELYGMGSQPQV